MIRYRSFFVNGRDWDAKLKYILFLVWPFGSFIYALRNIQSRSSQIVFFLICAAFGLCIETKNETFDMTRITEEFLSYRYVNFDFLYNEIVDSIQGVGDRDIYDKILFWIANQMSSNEHVFWMIASMVYAFFYLKSLSFVLKDDKFHSCLMGFMIVFMFTMPQPIFTVTGLRFWTAGWLAVLCTLQILRNNNYNYVLFLLLTPFIHVTYWIYVFLLLFVYIIKHCEKILICILFISYPFSYLSMSLVTDVIGSNLLPPSLELVALSYTDANHIASFNQKGVGWTWLEDIFDMMLSSYYLIMAFWLIKHRKLMERTDKKLFHFILIVYSFANFTLQVPHLGIRYLGFVNILLPYLWLRTFGLNRYKLFIYLYPLCAFFYLIRTRLFTHYASVLDFDFLYDSSFVMFFDKLFYY